MYAPHQSRRGQAEFNSPNRDHSSECCITCSPYLILWKGGGGKAPALSLFNKLSIIKEKAADYSAAKTLSGEDPIAKCFGLQLGCY